MQETTSDSYFDPETNSSIHQRSPLSRSLLNSRNPRWRIATIPTTTYAMDHHNHHLLLPHYRLYDFAKTALIKIFASPHATVCDLYCGGGADIHKWDDAQIGHYIGIDASSSGISEAWEN